MNYIKELKLKNILLKNNVFLAPMAGVTDRAFRKVCREFGPALTFTEMASSKAMEFNNKKTKNLLKIMENERPSAIQIFGSDAGTIKNTILKLNEESSIDIIDINMGCPAPKLVKNGDGAGLLKDLKNIDSILKEARKACTKILTVKTRKGFDDTVTTAVEVAKICEDNGIDMITVHGRTREEYYSGQADLDIIKKVKESVGIPVIGNGDINSAMAAKNMFEYTNCDGIMVARGAQGNPWIFKSILQGTEYIPTIDSLEKIIFKHIEYATYFEEEKLANLKLRKHIAWYLKGLDKASLIKQKVNTSPDIKTTKSILNEYFAYLKYIENAKTNLE